MVDSRGHCKTYPQSVQASGWTKNSGEKLVVRENLLQHVSPRHNYQCLGQRRGEINAPDFHLRVVLTGHTGLNVDRHDTLGWLRAAAG